MVLNPPDNNQTYATASGNYVRERRDLAKARREAFVMIPTRCNRVWQTGLL
jgi:hypothetical protein